MGTRLVIAGAGGFGREVHSWAEASPIFRGRERIESIVFLNDRDPDVPVGAPIVSTIDAYAPETDDLVLCAIGAPAARRAVASKLSTRGARFTTFVSDGAVIGDRVSLGAGTIVCPGTILTTDIEIGEQSHVNIGNMVGHDVRIGDFTTVSPSCNIMGAATLGDSVFLGTAVTVVPGAVIGDDATIGACSLVLRDIAAGVTAFGNPAAPRPIRST